MLGRKDFGPLIERHQKDQPHQAGEQPPNPSLPFTHRPFPISFDLASTQISPLIVRGAKTVFERSRPVPAGIGATRCEPAARTAVWVGGSPLPAPELVASCGKPPGSERAVA